VTCWCAWSTVTRGQQRCDGRADDVNSFEILLSGPDVGPDERAALLDAFDSGWVAPAGPHLARFESEIAEFVGWEGTVALSSGTAALHLALQESGVGAGDTVLVSTFTFAATANAVRYCGAEPVFVDSEASSWNMSPDLLDRAISRQVAAGKPPKAVVMVDLYGQCADADPIRSLCTDHRITLIEDAAEALGATYKGRRAGTLGDIAVLSFNGNKIVTTSGGGMVVAPRREQADRIRYLATQARQPVAHYEHTEIGYNYRLSNLLAAMGSAQLRRLPSMIERRRAINDLYRRAFAGVDPIEFMPIPDWSSWNGWLTCILFPSTSLRDRVREALSDDAVESRPLWKPMHMQPVFRGSVAVVDGTSEDLFSRGLCLPSGGALGDDDIDRVAAGVLRALT